MSEVKQQQTAEDLKKHLQQQIAFLKTSCDAFDNGDESEAKRLAVTLRILLHDFKKKSVSLLSQAGLKDISFFNSAYPVVPGNQLGHHGLVSQYMARGEDVRFMPIFDQCPPEALGTSSFDEWWLQPVIVDGNGVSFSRSRLVLTIADQDGGAHVDPGLDEAYAKLSRENSLGWLQGVARPILAVELASVRQIAHEVIKSLDPTYSKIQAFPKGGGVFSGMILVKNDAVTAFDKTDVTASSSAVATPVEAYPTKNLGPKIGRNAECPCNSGKKFKHCHGKIS